MLTNQARWQVAAGMSVSVWVEIAAAAAGTTIKDSFSVLSEVKGDTFQVPTWQRAPSVCIALAMETSTFGSQAQTGSSNATRANS